MRRWAAAWLCALGTGLAIAPAPQARASAAAISIQNFAFKPSNVTISAGESVTWTQQDMGTQHTATADDKSWGSQPLSTGQMFSHTFAQGGTFSYHCEIHPSMTGTITVTGSAPPPTTAPPPPPPAPVATAPAVQAAPTTVRPTTTVTTAPPTTTTTLAPPAAADIGSTTSTTTAAAGGGGVALPAQTASSSGDDLSPGLVALAIVLALGAAGGTFFVRRREGQPSG